MNCTFGARKPEILRTAGLKNANNHVSVFYQLKVEMLQDGNIFKDQFLFQLYLFY